MKYAPHEYQKYAINYIKTHPFSAVLLDMGLGKTSITLTAIGDLLFDSFEVVIDELSSFKNHQSKRFKALMQVRPRIKRVVGLTGTPASNGLMDLWAEFKVIDLGKRLGRFITHYRQEYFVPDAMNGQIVYSYRPKPGAEQEIYRKISDITISMKSTDHLTMPKLISSEYRVYLSQDEWDAYEETASPFWWRIGSSMIWSGL